MHAHSRLLERFHAAYADRDADEIVRCYDPRVTFTSPVYGTITAERVFAMQRMRCLVDHDRVVSTPEIAISEHGGTAQWGESHTFTGTGRLVRHVVRCRFRFEGGRIIRHEERFDIWRWAAMALGPIGGVFGWTPLLRRTIRREALETLASWHRLAGRHDPKS